MHAPLIRLLPGPVAYRSRGMWGCKGGCRIPWQKMFWQNWLDLIETWTKLRRNSGKSNIRFWQIQNPASPKHSISYRYDLALFDSSKLLLKKKTWMENETAETNQPHYLCRFSTALQLKQQQCWSDGQVDCLQNAIKWQPQDQFPILLNHGQTKSFKIDIHSFPS